MKYEFKDVVKIYEESFVEGYKFAVETANDLKDNIDVKYHAKHNKILKNLIEDLKVTLTILADGAINKAATEYLENRKIRNEIMAKEEEKKLIETSKPLIYKA